MARRKFTDNCEAIQVSPCGWDVIANGERSERSSIILIHH